MTDYEPEEDDAPHFSSGEMDAIVATSMYKVLIGDERYEPRVFENRIGLGREYRGPLSQPILPVAEAMRDLIAQPSRFSFQRSWELARRDETPVGYIGVLRGLIETGPIDGVVARTYRRLAGEAAQAYGGDRDLNRTLQAFNARF